MAQLRTSSDMTEMNMRFNGSIPEMYDQQERFGTESLQVPLRARVVSAVKP